MDVLVPSEDRSDTLFEAAARAIREPAQFERLIVIAAPVDGEPRVWCRGLSLIEMASLCDFIRHASLTEALG